MRYSTVIFDLDGTVLDTLTDLANAVNYALEQYAFPTHTIETIRTYIGNGVANLIHRSVPAGTSDETCEQVLACFKTYYGEHMNDNTRPYSGIPEMLSALKQNGVFIGINSNKFDKALQNLCRLHFDGLFDYAVGESEITPKKPDPTAAQRILDASNCEKSNAIYIGDSDVDLRTAENAGIDSAWVSWGFRRRNELSTRDIPNAFDTPHELLQFLLK